MWLRMNCVPKKIYTIFNDIDLIYHFSCWKTSCNLREIGFNLIAISLTFENTGIALIMWWHKANKQICFAWFLTRFSVFFYLCRCLKFTSVFVWTNWNWVSLNWNVHWNVDNKCNFLLLFDILDYSKKSAVSRLRLESIACSTIAGK